MYFVSDIKLIIELILRLMIATVLGGLVGLERKRRKKEAGIRTHAMVALGSAIFTIASKYGFLDIVFLDGANVDVSRVAANVVTGVCFLGAGMIFVKSKSITGLTTAAGIWAVSAIGLAIGCGMYAVGIASALVILSIQFILYQPLSRIEGPSTREMCCVIEDYKKTLPDFDKCLKELDPTVYYCAMEKNHDGSMTLKFKIKVRQAGSEENIFTFIRDHEYVRSISC